MKVYINWANTSLFFISGTLPTLKLPIKSHLSSRWLLSSDVVLISSYHSRKGEAIKLIPYYMIDIIYKIAKLSQLKKNCESYKISKPNVPSHLHSF